MRYNNYHKHDHVSNIFSPDTNTKAEEYILKALQYGHTSYFTTNHGSFGDIFEARTLCNKYGIKCIAGIEGYIVPDASEKDKSNYHIVVIPKTNNARKKMNYVSSMANINGFYYKPRFFLQDLLALDVDDVFITTACTAGLLRDKTSVEKIFIPLVQHFGKNVMLEVQTHQHESQKEINKKAIYFSEKYDLSLIAANDSHYINEDGKIERLNLLKGKHINYGDEDDFILDYPTAEVMINRFREQNILSEQQIINAIQNTLVFDECEEIQLDYSIKMPTIYPELTPNERLKLLKKEVNRKFQEIRKEENISEKDYKIYKQGIRYEMKIIEDTNEEVHTADYFLFNEKNVDLAVNKYGGVLTRGGRGSCGSFYINRILGMTQLDRFKINLPLFPDRFASTARLLENRSLPDIDFNVKEQEPFVKASRELLGEHGCYPMYAPGTMQISEAFRNVCRSKNIDYDDFNDVAKNIDSYMENEKWKPLIEEANKYVGTIVSGSVHPCAHILSNENLLYEYGVTRLGEKLCVLITSSEADEYKVLKNDYLIVKVWKLIDETFKEIGEPIIPANKLLNLIKDDKRVWNLFKNGITCTLNQVDSDNGSMQAKKYGIHSFEDGAYIAAAIRPSFDSWREQFLNREKYTTGSTLLDEVLSSTHGYILFQESLMQYFDWLGVTPAESIGLIKKISKKKIKPEDFASLEERLRNKWIENTGSEVMFNETWSMIQSCISYGFCSAHAAATSLDMCYGAYLKANYPLEYYTVCFNNYADDQVRTNKLKKELEYFGIKLSNIQFRYSTSRYSYEKSTNTIYKGMASIKYINDDVGDELYTLRENQYSSFIELLIDLKQTSINSKQLDILIKLDFFKEFGEVNMLLKQVEYFDKIYGKKQFKKSKLKELNIPLEIAEKYVTKVTEKTLTGVDSRLLLLELVEDYMNYIPTTITDHLKYEKDNLGYNTTICPNASKRLYYVSSLDVKKSVANIQLYEIFSGKTRKVKMWTSQYNKCPFFEHDILYIILLNKKAKKEPTGEINQTTGKKIYRDVVGEYEYWLEKFVIKDNVDEEENINV